MNPIRAHLALILMSIVPLTGCMVSEGPPPAGPEGVAPGAPQAAEEDPSGEPEAAPPANAPPPPEAQPERVPVATADQVWIGGRYRWAARRGVYVWVPGHWAMRSAPQAPPAPVVEVEPAARSGLFWVRGHYIYNGARYVWVRGHWDTVRTGYVFAPAHWERGPGGWRYIEGSWVRR